MGPDFTTWFSEDRSREPLAGDSLEFMPSRYSNREYFSGWEDEVSLSTQLVHKTSVAAVSEVKCSLHQHDAARGVQKRIVHVACAPSHDCIAFDRWQAEQDRKSAVDDIAGLLQPATQRRFEDGSGNPAPTPQEGSLRIVSRLIEVRPGFGRLLMQGQGSDSARSKELQKMQAFPRKWLVASGPRSARLPRERSGYVVLVRPLYDGL